MCCVNIYECEYIGDVRSILDNEYYLWNLIFVVDNNHKYVYGNNIPTDWRENKINYSIYNILRTTDPDFNLVKNINFEENELKNIIFEYNNKKHFLNGFIY